MKLYRILTILILVITVVAIFTPTIKNKRAEMRGYDYKDRVLVLTYHHIAQQSNSVTITPKLFYSHMKVLKDEGYNVISMADFVKFMDKKGTVPKNAVLITFDDGYESFYTEAAPILNKYHFVATNFVVVSSTVLQNTKIPHLTWDEMRKLQQQGMTFYSHTYNSHLRKKGDQGYVLGDPIYKTESPEEVKQRIVTDLKDADTYLQNELGNKDKLLAFPNGAYNQTALQLAEDEGIRYFFTIQEGINTPEMERKNIILRVTAGTPNMTAETFKEKLKMYNQ